MCAAAPAAVASHAVWMRDALQSWLPQEQDIKRTKKAPPQNADTRARMASQQLLIPDQRIFEGKKRVRPPQSTKERRGDAALHRALPDGLLQGHFSVRRRTRSHCPGVLTPSHVPQNTPNTLDTARLRGDSKRDASD